MPRPEGNSGTMRSIELALALAIATITGRSGREPLSREGTGELFSCDSDMVAAARTAVRNLHRRA